MIVGNPQGSSITRPVGVEFTYGIQVLALQGAGEAVITDVETVGGSEGLEQLGAMVVPPPRHLAAIQFLEGWPPVEVTNGDLAGAVEAVGAEVGAQATEPQGWELLLGIKVVKDGYWHQTGIRVTYEIADERFQVTLPTELVVCTNEEYEEDGSCPS